MKIKTACCSIIGRSHIKNRLPCQDYTYTFKNGGFTILVVCDGAGSCKYSREGAEVVAKTVVKMMFKKFDIFYYFISKLNGDSTVAHLITKKVKNELKKKGKQLNTTLNELSSTLMFIAVKDYKYICGHIGDGAIGISKNKKFEVLSKPDNSEFANSTYFITGNYAEDKLRLYAGCCKDINGFIAMTDGSTTKLYDKQNKKMAKACDKILNYLKKNSKKSTKKLLKKLITQKILPETTDDCSIGIIFIPKTHCYNKTRLKKEYSKEILYNYLSNKIKKIKYIKLYNRAMDHYKNGRMEDSLKCFEKLLDQSNIEENRIFENAKKYIINIYYNLGEYNYKLKNLKNAKNYYAMAKSKCIKFGFKNKISIFEEKLNKIKYD